MHLNKLVMRNFKKFRRAEVEFQDGLTGIVGSNGAGKSTIVEAIAWALYGNRASSIKRDYIRNARAGDSDPVEVRLSLSLGKQEMTIYRAMKGKGLMPEAYLLLDNHRIAAGTKEVDQRLEEILKISYQDFMKTFYARQKDLDNLLKEGGTGKREYLLKLLGLDDIRELAIEQIKSDRIVLEEQKSRLAGAIAEIGDVEARLVEAARGIQLAEGELKEAENLHLALEDARKKRAHELEIQEEKMHSHALLDEKRSLLEAQALAKREAIEKEQTRLADIEALKSQLADLEPCLQRLRLVRERLELLEPKRKAYEETYRKMAAAEAGIDGMKRALQENEERLLKLRSDAALLEELRPKEEEHRDVKALLSRLEGLRNRYLELCARLKEETIRMSATESNLRRAEDSIKGLLLAKARLEEIQPRLKETRLLLQEQKEMSIQRERQKELDGLASRRKALEERRERLESEAVRVRLALEGLGDLEEQERMLRAQDKELDGLGTDLNSILADLRGSLKVQERALLDAQRSVKKVTALGEKGVCPTCERPLEGQHEELLKKYKLAAFQAEKEISDLQTAIRSQMEKMDKVTRSRSNLKKGFDDLNAKKSHRSALQADLHRLKLQISDTRSELDEILARIEALGPVRFDLQRMEMLEAALNELAPLMEECRSLTVRMEELPRKETERESLHRQRLIHEGNCRDLDFQIQALGFADSEYADARRRLEKLVPLHDRFLSLQEKAQEIPHLEEKISLQQQELIERSLILQRLQGSLQSLGFDLSEYEALQKEHKHLARMEEESQKIQLKIATEPEIERRLKEAALALEDLEKDLATVRRDLAALGYSIKEHESVKVALSKAEKDLEAAQKAVSEKKVQLGILKGGLERLEESSQRKKEHERTLGDVARKLEVVDTTRSLVIGFMDQVLLRVKKDIAKTAGEILDEVSGKYSLLKIDDDFNILVEDGGEYYPISRYSGGEIDMIAVSVRVAISEYLMRFGPEGESYSFLIMDEVFGSQDLEHREKMIGMLRSLEERFPQIIAISHISDVQGQFDNTLQVVEDEMGNSRIEVV